jgi:isopentenyl diphosphate isomerase/L-lactate dehydrogenase-like FMN-dependent dehydrogenase
MSTISRIQCSGPDSKSPEEDLGAAIGHYLGIYVNPSLTWEELERLREWTSLPVLLKGILKTRARWHAGGSTA